jgi:hypothetical protein
MNEDEKEALAKFRGHLISATKIADEQKWGNTYLVNLQTMGRFSIGFNIVRIIDMILDMTANAIVLDELADEMENKLNG